MSSLLDRIDDAIAEKNLLRHPFYQAWTAGELTLEDLALYSGQYFKQVRDFPRYLGHVYARCEDVTLRRRVLENIVEEDHGEDNHLELWLRFAEGVGLPRERCEAAEALPHTAEAVATLGRLAEESSPAAAMASIYAYEAMVPEVAEAKIDGLRRFYGIDDARTLEFFTVHEAADREHRQWDRELIEALVRDEEDGAACERAAHQALDALWTLLSGVHAHCPSRQQRAAC